MTEFVETIPLVGIIDWFPLNDYNHTEHSVNDLKQIGIKELRTGVSWVAEINNPDTLN